MNIAVAVQNQYIVFLHGGDLSNLISIDINKGICYFISMNLENEPKWKFAIGCD